MQLSSAIPVSVTEHDPARQSARIHVSGMHCAGCAARLQNVLLKVDGVSKAEVNYPLEMAVVETDDSTATINRVSKAIKNAGFTVERDNRIFDIEGMHCASCVKGVENELLHVPGVESAEVGLTPQRARVTLIDSSIENTALITAIEARGFTAQAREDNFTRRLRQDAELRERETKARQQTFRLMLLGIVLSIPFIIQMIWMLSGHDMLMPAWLEFCLATPVLFIVGSRFFRQAWVVLRTGSANMDTLVVVGASAAWLFSVIQWLLGTDVHGLYFEATAFIVSLVMVGRWLEERARGAATDAVAALVRLRPVTARRVDNEGETQIPIERVEPGDRLKVLPGERLPADGVVTDGISDVDMSMISGESTPVTIRIGDKVTGGGVNRGGVFIFEVTATGNDTMLARIVELVENAQTGKVGVQRLVDRVSAVFVPVVLLVSIVTGVIWLIADTGNGSMALAAAISVVVIACPCALGLATPTALVTGIGTAARRGILIRDIATLESAGRVATVVFDKTGTLTIGDPQVDRFIVTPGCDADESLQIAASLLTDSEHPYAAALVRYSKERGVNPSPASEFENLPGRGVSGRIGERRVMVGNAELLRDFGVDLLASTNNIPSTRSYLVIDGAVWAVIDYSDMPRPEAAAAIERLKHDGVHCVMLTGDNVAIASQVAGQLGLDDYVADLSPADKAEWIVSNRDKGQTIAMVGDGINDAPALANADVGIAMGTGTDIARLSANIILMRADLNLVADAFSMMQATRRKIRQNLFWAFIYNCVAIPFAAMGYLSPAIAAAAMSLSSVSVVGNSLLLKRWKRPENT
ncbi:MAG: copper-transporting ATPase [marine bacterium B5-7]|nr:MAG: copper-transporting ATPase [marine bacterium B5-7]